MSLTSGIEQHAARSLASVQLAPSPRPSIELRRVKHADTESDTKGISARGNDLGGFSTEGNRAQAVSSKARKLLEIQYGCLCLALFLAGWNDGTNGPLIPRIRRYYNVSSIVASFPSPLLSDYAQINFTLVSLIFITNCVVSTRSKHKRW